MNKPNLDARLLSVAKFVRAGAYVCDIGTDHAYLPVYLVLIGRASRALASDINKGPVMRAKESVAKYGVSDKIDIVLSDGLKGAEGYPVTDIIIAGMGGETIAEILEGADGKLDVARLILQPNVAAPYLRRKLNACGYRINREKLVRDGRRIYLILEAAGGRQTLTDMETEVGPVLLRERPALLKDYAAFRLRVAKKALAGAENGSDAGNIAALRKEIAIWEEVDACL